MQLGPNRADHSSQGGFLVFAIDEDGISNGTTKPLVVLDWASRRLRRVCRSSLAAEAQAACVSVDALEWTKLFIPLLIHPDRAADDEELTEPEEPASSAPYYLLVQLARGQALQHVRRSGEGCGA